MSADKSQDKNENWPPHITVASVIEKDGKFLLVEEISAGRLVFNQPAGHLEPNESLAEAAVRETLEETGWHSKPLYVLGISKYIAPHNGTIYYRTTFISEALDYDPSIILDDGIQQAVWLDVETLRANPDKLRSPLVLENIEQYLNGEHYPLSMIND